MKIIYFEEQDYQAVFDTIARHYNREFDPAPDYRSEKSGLEQYSGVLERIKNDSYYTDFLEKISYMYTTLVEGHYFSNGNKRLAFLSAIKFIDLNHLAFADYKLKDYKLWFREHFPYEKLEKRKLFSTHVEWAFANLTLFIALSSKNFDTLKSISKEFFDFILRKEK